MLNWKHLPLILAIATSGIQLPSGAQESTNQIPVEKTTTKYIRARIVKVAKGKHIPPALALAIAETESHFRYNVPDRVEPKISDSSVGIFQLLTGTAESVGFVGTQEQLRHPDVNIHFGIEYLSKCHKRFGTNVTRVACCYNAGEFATDSVCENDENVLQYQDNVNTAYQKWSKRL